MRQQPSANNELCGIGISHRSRVDVRNREGIEDDTSARRVTRVGDPQLWDAPLGCGTDTGRRRAPHDLESNPSVAHAGARSA